MTLVFSYGIEETDRCHLAGYTLIGIGLDASGKEAVVFKKPEMPSDLQDIPARDVASRLDELIQNETNPATLQVLQAAYRQLQCLRTVHNLLDGTEYDSDTASDIARWLVDAGFEIRDLDEMEEEEAS